MSGDLEATLQEIIDTAEEWMASEWAPKYYALCGEEKRERDLKLIAKWKRAIANQSMRDSSSSGEQSAPLALTAPGSGS